MTAIPLILASSSVSRRTLLERLQLEFTCVSPEIEEAALPGEPIEHQVLRLAEAKVRAVAADAGDAFIIGSDQLAELAGQRLGKPGDHTNAMRQLQAMSGQHVRFYTAVCLLNTQTGSLQNSCVVYDILYRELSQEQINYYLQQEQPYHCAGSFKSEALGVALIERMDGPDPTALVGLPLITLVGMLQNQGFNVL